MSIMRGPHLVVVEASVTKIMYAALMHRPLIETSVMHLVTVPWVTAYTIILE